MDWLTGWANSVVQASNTDSAERAAAAAEGTAEAREGGTVQARRRAMKAAIREKYAFSGTAKQWAREIEAALGRSAGRKEVESINVGATSAGLV